MSNFAEQIDALAATPRLLAETVVEVADAVLDTAMGDAWAPRTILAHLRDDEYLVMRQRLERMLAEDGPVFPDFDEKAWAAGRNRDRDATKQLLTDFALQRQASLAILRGLSAAQRERAGRHAVDGAYTVASWVEHWREHDAVHLEQLRDAIRAAGGAPPPLR